MLLGRPESCQGLVPTFECIGVNRGASAPSAEIGMDTIAEFPDIIEQGTALLNYMKIWKIVGLMKLLK